MIPIAHFIWEESFYFDKVLMLSPIEINGDMPIRNDWRGEGDFGTKRSGNRKHAGIDILSPIGTPVRAVKGGYAISGFVKDGMGYYVKIRHKKDLMTVYGHLSKVYLKETQMVRQGQPIGEVGNTGNAKFNGILPHLHMELRQRGVPIDPKEYMEK